MSHSDICILYCSYILRHTFIIYVYTNYSHQSIGTLRYCIIICNLRLGHQGLLYIELSKHDSCHVEGGVAEGSVGMGSRRIEREELAEENEERWYQ